MTATEAVGTGVRDLDRRVLGAGTTLRFALLVVLVTAGSLQLIWTGAPRPVRDGVREPWTVCALSIGQDLGDMGLSVAMRLFRTGASDQYQQCLARYSYTPWPWAVGGMALVLAAAALQYWLLPRWKARGDRLVPVRDPELAAELAELTWAAGLTRQPAFVMDPVAGTPSAVVFGRWRSHTVSLHGRLIARRRADPEGFRTVVLHELAHIRNGDVGIAYATEALWRAFAVVVLLPYTLLSVYPWTSVTSPGAVVTLWRTDWELGLHQLVRPLLLLALVLLARADVLRTRELYADLDASRWSGARSLPAAPEPPGAEGKGALRGAARRFAALWRTHPAWRERERSLLDPAAMFGVQATTMFLTAIAVMVVVVDIEVVTAGSPVPVRWIDRATAWPSAALVTGIAGVGLWRAVTHAVLTGRRVPSGLRAGVWLGLGLAAGQVVTFQAAGTGWLPPEPLVLLVLVAGSAVLTWWVAQCAEVWIRTCRGRSLNGVHLIGLAAMLVVFGAWFEWWYTGGYLYLTGRSLLPMLTDMAAQAFPDGSAAEQRLLHAFLPGLSVLVQLNSVPLLSASGVLLWVFPLAAWARRPVTGVPPWVRRALPHGEVPTSAWSGLPPLRRPLAYGVVGGALVVCAVAATRAWLRPQSLPDGNYSPVWIMVVHLWLAIAVCGATALVSVLVFVRSRRHALPVAMAAAGTAMLLGLGGEFALNAGEGCVKPIAVLGTVCGWRTPVAWYVMRALLGPLALGMGFYAVTVAALAGVTVKAAAARWRKGPRAGAIRQEAARAWSPRGPWRWAAPAVGGAVLGAAAVVALRAALHLDRPPELYGAWTEGTQIWTATTLVLAVALAGLLGLVLTRSRTVTLTAVGSALGTAAVTVFVLQSADGCIGPLNVLASTCGWRPAASWLVIRVLVAPATVAVATCAAAALTVLAAVWRLARGRGRLGLSGPEEPPVPAAVAAAWTRPPWGRRAWLAVATAAAVALVSGWWSLSSGPIGQSFAGVTVPSVSVSPSPLPTPSPTGPAAQVRLRLAAWSVTGGRDLLKQFVADIGALAPAVDAVSKGDGTVDQATFGPLCDRWAEHGRQALAGTPVPEPSLQKLWRQAATDAAGGGQACARALKAGDGDGFTAAVGRLSRAATELGAFVDRLRDLSSAP